MQRVFAIVVVTLVAAASAACLLPPGKAAEPIARAKPAADEKTRVNYFQLGQDVEVIGALGRPLGKVLVVEGMLFEPKRDEQIPKAYTWKTIFVAERLNGEPLAKPIHVSLKEPQASEQYNLKSKRKIKLTGYEDGGFVEQSAEVSAYLRKRGELERARTGRHFNVDFYVLDPQPADGR